MITRAGWSVLAAAVVLYALGWVLGYVQLMMAAAACLAAVAVAAGWMVSRFRLDVTRSLEPPRVTVGDTAEGVIRVVNRATRSNPPVLAQDRVGETTIDGVIGRIRPGATGTSRYGLLTDQRGIYPVGPLSISRSDPIGLMRRSQRYGTTESLFVYPLVYPVTPMPAGLSRDVEGPTSDTAPEGTITFHTLREYVVGDDLRAIHWKATARIGKLMVRKHVDTSQPHTTVVLDTRRRVHTPDSFEHAVEAAASICVASLTRNFPVQLRSTDGLHVEGRSGRGSPIEAYMDRLAGVELVEEGSMAGVVAAMTGERGGNSLAIVTSSLADPADLARFAPLGRRYDVITLVNLRPDAGALPPISSNTLVLDVETGLDFAQAWNLSVSR